jgi:carbamoyl-phosphate synthase large subunit
LSAALKQTLIDYASRIAKSAPIIGMMNIQFVIFENVVYVLEVNPRSSRTVPIMSKVTGIPMIEWATRVQLGDRISDLCSEQGLLAEPNYYSVKTPVFSSSKLKGVDHVLGPEMKSTGELLGLGVTFQAALNKALPLKSLDGEKYIFCSISDREKPLSLPIISQLVKKQVKIAATEGTALFLHENGIQVEKVVKDDQDVNNLFRNQKMSAVINIPNQGRNKIKFGFHIREQATRYNVPVFTHLDTVEAIMGLQSQSISDSEVRSVSEYYKMEVSDKAHVKST